jgi:hypothetical protein
MYFDYKIYIHEKCLQNENDKFQKSPSRPSVIDVRDHYWATARRLRSPALRYAHTGTRLACFEWSIHTETSLTSARKIFSEEATTPRRWDEACFSVNATVKKPLSFMEGNKRRWGLLQCGRTYTRRPRRTEVPGTHFCQRQSIPRS